MKIIKKIFLSSVIIFQTVILYSQVSVIDLNRQEKIYFQTIKNVTAFLKSHTTKYSGIQHEYPLKHSSDEAFYDSVINTYFDKENLLKRLQKDTLVFAIDGKLDILRHLLFKCDWYLDIIPTDSLFIRPYRCYDKKNLIVDHLQDVKSLSDIFDIYLLIQNKEVDLLTVLFSPETGKLLIIDGASPQEDEREILHQFLKRQKNYYDFPKMN